METLDEYCKKLEKNSQNSEKNRKNAKLFTKLRNYLRKRG